MGPVGVLVGLILLSGNACTCTPEPVGAGRRRDGGPGSDGSTAAPTDANGSRDGSTNGCAPPDMLIVLDRTMSMHRRPDSTVPSDTPAGHRESKWYLAINAIEGLTAELDDTIRFGLELFPRDGGGCVTLSQRIQGTTATNAECEAGEVLVPPNVATSAAIDGALDVETTVLCSSTPIGAGLVTAKTALEGLRIDGREQYVILITDGQDTCDETIPLLTVQGLAAAGIRTHVIGFDASGGGIDRAMLNNLACAGQSAAGFPGPCIDDGAGGYRASDPRGADLFLTANDADTLTAALEGVAGGVCCGCLI